MMGRVLRWAMGTFRIIVIVTEMVVMAAFLSRFWLDAENSNLTNSIKIAASQIQVQSDFEKEFRNLQSKTVIYKQIKSGVKYSARVNFAALKTPENIVLTSINSFPASTDIKGISESEADIAQFISNLKTDEDVKKVSLGTVDTSDDSSTQISFQIIVSY